MAFLDLPYFSSNLLCLVSFSFSATPTQMKTKCQCHLDQKELLGKLNGGYKLNIKKISPKGIKRPFFL
jgi:hypothetical protein